MSLVLRAICSTGLCAGLLFGQAATRTGSPQPTPAAAGTAETDFLEEDASRPVPQDLEHYFDLTSGALLPDNAIGFFDALLPKSADCGSDKVCWDAVRNFAGLYKKGVRNDKAVQAGPFLVHVVIWSPKGTSTTQTVKDDRWYVYRKGHLSTSKQLYGAKRFWFIYVHLNVHTEYRSRYDFKIVEATPAALQHLYALAALLTSSTIPAAPTIKRTLGAIKPPTEIWGGREINSEFSTSDVTIASTFTTLSNPQPPGNPPAAALAAPPALPPESAPASARAALLAPVVLFNAAPLPQPAAVSLAMQDDNPQPSAPAPAPNTLDSPQTFHNETPSWWDVSVGFPVTAVNQLTFNGSSSGLVPQQIDKRRLFGLLDLYWLPSQRMDIAKHGYSWVPSFIAGLPMASQPMHRPLFALGWGPPLIQIYAGAILAKQPTVTGNMPVVGKPCTGWCPQFSFGLNIGVKAAQDKLSTSKQK